MLEKINSFKPYQGLITTGICLALILLGIGLENLGSSWAATSFIFAFIIGGFQSAKEGLEELLVDKHLSVDVLMILAAIGSGLLGYWMEGALLIFIFSLSASLEELAVKKSKEAITTLMQLTPDRARKIQADGQIVIIDTAEIKVGDLLQVPKGEVVPLDGQLLTTYGVFDESMVTGEPVFAEKEAGSLVIGGTINQGETIQLSVTAEKGQALFDQIVQLVEQAQESKSKTATLIEKMEDPYVKLVLCLVPCFILLAHFGLNWDWQTAFYRGMILLTIASPCALVASSAPATLAAISRAARKGLMIKGGDVAEAISGLKAIVFDKTGTLTAGKPEVTEVAVWGEPDVISQVVLTLESQSSHPIAQALVAYHTDLEMLDVTDMEEVVGRGLTGHMAGHHWRMGKKAFVLEDTTLTREQEAVLIEAEDSGRILVYVSQDEQLVALYQLEDKIKPESFATIQQVKSLGIVPILLTGDQEAAARHVAEQLGIDQVVANCLPTDKSKYLEQFQAAYEAVGMVGDGINDAPALAQAHVSYAMGTGTAIAMEAADIVVMDDLTKIPFSIRLSRRLKGIIWQNIVFSLAVIALLILSNLNQAINLPLGVVGHEGSTILVILNGLRLLYVK